jgi:hypothetical protein
VLFVENDMPFPCSILFFCRDADFIFSTLMEYQTSVMLNVTPEQHARAHGSFLSTVVAKFTPESFNMLRRYFEAKGDSKSLTALFLKSQQPADAGNVLSIRGFFEQDFREQQGMLSVRGLFLVLVRSL